MSNNAMSNETDLDWLARNVHHWGSDHARTISYSTEFGGERYGDGLPYPKYTKDQWVARRAELQNKPSWRAVPSHANWLAQDAAGSWLWHSSEPECRNGGWIGSTTRGYAAKGCVIGDWCDTLEKRPEEFKPSIEEANKLAQEFKLFTSIEDNQEQEMKQDNGWFERVELPPVGVECDIRHSCWNSEKYEKVTVAAITNEYLIVKYATFEQHYMLKDISFRPIRTERDELIEIISSSLLVTTEQVADAILAAGFSRRDK